MIHNIDDVRKLFETKKENSLVDDIEKINNLEVLLSNDRVFFSLNPNTAIGILRYLGVEESELLKSYSRLISLNKEKNYITLSNKK